MLRLTEARSGARVCDPQELRNVSKPDRQGFFDSSTFDFFAVASPPSEIPQHSVLNFSCGGLGVFRPPNSLLMSDRTFYE